MQREMYAKQNTFGCLHVFFYLNFFLSDPPAVIVNTEVILQDVCERKRSVFLVFFNALFPSFTMYNKAKLPKRQKQCFEARVWFDTI